MLIRPKKVVLHKGVWIIIIRSKKVNFLPPKGFKHILCN